MTTRTPFAVERDGSEVALIIRGTVTPFRRGNTRGHPDTWSPDEGGEVEIDAIHLDDGHGNEGALWTGELTDAERSDVEEELRLAAADEAELDAEYEAASRYEDAMADDRGEW